MSINMNQDVWTLSQVSRILNVAQHRLIYLCEKEVIVPDFGSGKGRGTSRGFSAGNILEFAVALELRRFMIPIGPIRPIIYVLRAFGKILEQQVPDFSMVSSFRRKQSPDLRIIISDGERLFFLLGHATKETKLFGGIDFKKLLTKRGRVNLTALPRTGKEARGWGGYEGTRHARIEINVTAIARDLNLED